MADQDIRELFERFYDTVSEGEPGAVESALDELIAEDFVEHEDLPPGMPPGREGVKAWFSVFMSAVPDLQMTLEDFFSEGDRGVARYRLRGTQQGELMGIPATGKSFDVHGFDILRVADGKAVEHWGVTDTFTMLQQLGVMDLPDG